MNGVNTAPEQNQKKMEVESMKISAVIPAYNEKKRIHKVLEETEPYVDEIIVIDDHSKEMIKHDKARVLRNEKNLGYIRSIKRGFEEAEGDIIVTLDADGEHDPRFIPLLVKPILEGRAEVVFGKRNYIPRLSERLISKMVKRRVGAEDTGTGFRAVKRDIAVELKLKGKCTCGIFALEAHQRGARITEVSAPTRETDKPRGIAWDHFAQIFMVLRLCSPESISHLRKY